MGKVRTSKKADALVAHLDFDDEIYEVFTGGATVWTWMDPDDGGTLDDSYTLADLLQTAIDLGAEKGPTWLLFPDNSAHGFFYRAKNEAAFLKIIKERLHEVEIGPEGREKKLDAYMKKLKARRGGKSRGPVRGERGTRGVLGPETRGTRGRHGGLADALLKLTRR